MSKLTHLRGIFSLVMSQRGMRSNFWLVARCLLVLACCSFVFAYYFLLFARCSLLFTRCSTRNYEYVFLNKIKQKSSPY